MKTSFFPHKILSVPAALLLLSACNKPGEKRQDPVRLDITETANCYIVEQAGLYSFTARIRGNGRTVPGTGIPASIEPENARLVWQSQKGFIDTLYLQDGDIVFNTPSSTAGNALVAATDAAGRILWSWHIWNPGIEIQELESQEGDTFMNVNLGALASDPEDPQSYGLLYQWGRKDPLPGSPTLTGTTATQPVPVYDMNGQETPIGHSSYNTIDANTLQYSIENPATCISNMAQFSVSRDWIADGEGSDKLWGNSPREEGATGKTMFDPSPAGWRVPDPDAFSFFTRDQGYCWTMSDFNVEDRNGNGSIGMEDYLNGWWFFLDSAQQVSCWFPAAARYDGSYAMLMGSVSGLWGSYWSNAAYPNAIASGTAQAALSFSVKDQNGNEMITVSPVGSAAKADAYSIRCVKE